MSRNDFEWMREVQDFSNRLKNYFEKFDAPGSAPKAEQSGALPADLLLVDGAYRADIEIPGMLKEEILITMAGNALEISGQRKAGIPENAEVLEHGRWFGSFQKRIELPGDADIDLEGVKASYENGVLRVTLPKRAKDPGVAIPIV
jgi:HSP20 family protein